MVGKRTSNPVTLTAPGYRSYTDQLEILADDERQRPNQEIVDRGPNGAFVERLPDSCRCRLQRRGAGENRSERASNPVTLSGPPLGCGPRCRGPALPRRPKYWRRNSTSEHTPGSWDAERRTLSRRPVHGRREAGCAGGAGAPVECRRTSRASEQTPKSRPARRTATASATCEAVPGAEGDAPGKRISRSVEPCHANRGTMTGTQVFGVKRTSHSPAKSGAAKAGPTRRRRNRGVRERRRCHRREIQGAAAGDCGRRTRIRRASNPVTLKGPR